MTIRRVAILTAGGFAPCLSTAVGGLIEHYTKELPEAEIIGYQYGYHGLLTGNFVVFDDDARANAATLKKFGGSPIGNSRVKLTNSQNLVDRGLIKPGENALEVAAEQLRKDGVDVLHTIGGDDTNTTAADLAAYLHENDYELTVVGLPKTIDNDIVPIRQSLGAYTAAEQAAKFAQNVIGEHRSNPRMLIIHEVMGRACGYLTAQATQYYREWLNEQEWVPSAGLSKERWDVHGVYLPEITFDLDVEGSRLRKIMDEQGNVNIFLSEGAGVEEIIEEMLEDGIEVERDPFGHVKLDTINPGQWFANQFAKIIGAEKVMVQKSGYFSRSAASNAKDLELIESMVELAVKSAQEGVSGVIGHDEEDNDTLKAIDFTRIAGHKAFDVSQPWFHEIMDAIGQEWEPKPAK
ncbi:pyrophosphate--fructose-6-phosphate 1-phosphotransferase [Arcanobacterium haemolyticum]|uniref:Pyrophosphate--fructose 6-phosphate 1-phosphotransferase n=1 Tax=Arcanobacterium haemolyticum (strain ATCC 9345 / DSM 20595 / CCM 5947 / CCUG 17215 / LMG 16163 / NBRC 15585 / NCTC 8452 / 11018) TaxID=644284 RepID=D7BNI5_ARCHD|nr:pyrophosphate--fructose-6-phosphate 1-phosphotransferase [Arcanobacterium haemolyticum]ADH92484.1 phosphofructokinase [Arcanobacterium haemolyticum DSM 20595]QCX46611.1 pyrophosphate--fructose-6-phosphate 1-phosphotransferase [Arcanobacterium haemolyticum]SPT75442.1 Pyrophosphate--fructose 6-phosphate 1-phosphotransferase [Arcanobacterium haemolyticum]SQH28786.1 Pyrophosphate--fructose 6-phosphate 1-phosphotransferase [Arcanobacterium haemolyticum]